MIFFHKTLRAGAVLLLPLLAACASDDGSARSLSQGFKGGVDWVRDAFGTKVAKLPEDDPNTPFPPMPNDPRPVPRSLKKQNDLIGGLKTDHATAAQVETALAKSGEPSRYLTLDGAKPGAAPIKVAMEKVALPDGIRDIDSYDPSHAGSSFDVAEIDFTEGSADLPDDADGKLHAPAQLLRKAFDAAGGDRSKAPETMRVAGFSGSDRVVVEGTGGPHEANRALADLRARRIAERLIALGAPASQLLVGPAPEAVRATGDKVQIIIDY